MSADQIYYGPSRTLPNVVEAEEALIGAALINPESYWEVADILKPVDFYLHKHIWIWEVIAKLCTSGQPVDIITVSDGLETKGKLTEVGGLAYLTRLISNVPDSMHAVGYATLVAREALNRRILVAATDLAQLAYLEELDEVAKVTKARGLVDGLKATNKSSITTSEQAADGVLAAFSARHFGDGTVVDRVTTGYKFIDEKTGGGYPRAKLSIVHGVPSLGKTSFCAGGGINAARSGTRILVIAHEDGSIAWNRVGMYAAIGIDDNYAELRASGKSEADIDAEKQTDFERLQALHSQVKDFPIIYITLAELSLASIRAEIRMAERELGGIDCLYLDHFHLINHWATASKGMSEPGAIGRSSVELKELAGAYNCAVVAIAQDTKAVYELPDAGKTGEPQRKDIYGSAIVDQTARFVAAVHYDEAARGFSDAHQNLLKRGITWAHIPYQFYVQKNTDGPVGNVPLWFKRSIRKFWARQ